MVERTNTITVRKFAYDSRTPQVEVYLITFRNYTQSISCLGVRPLRHVCTTITQQNIAYNCNIINSRAFACCASTEFTAPSTEHLPVVDDGAAPVLSSHGIVTACHCRAEMT